MPQDPQDPYAAIAKPITTSAPVDDPYAAIAKPIASGPPQESQSLLGKVWDAVSKPVADYVLPKDVKTADILKAAAFEKMGLGAYVPGVNDFDTKAHEHFGESPTKDAVKAFVAGATKDASGMAASATSPASLAMMGMGAATEIPGAVGTLAKTGSVLSGVGLAGKGVSDVASAGPLSTPEGAQQALSGASEIAGGSAMAAPGIQGVKLAASRAALLGKTPAEAYQSALKPSTTIPPAKVESMVKTGLENEIPVSKAGTEKLQSLLEDLQDKVTQEIGSGKGRTIDPQAVANRTNSLKSDFSNQVNPNADLQAIEASKQEFLKNQEVPPVVGQGPPNMRQIPADQAQAMKVGTYRQLGNKAYGELGSATKESQKALARGLKEELANAFPELSNLNAQESKIYDLQPVLEKAVQRQGNHQIMGIGTPAVGLGVKAVTGSSSIANAAAIMKLVVDNPVVKSRLAISLNKAGVPWASAQGRIAAYSGALAAASSGANSDTRDHQTTELQPQ